MSTIELDFESVYADYQPKILRYLSRMVGETDAEDLTQEVFVKISRNLTSFQGKSQLSTWIYRIATNTALDRLRSRNSPTVQTEQPVDSQTDGSEADFLDQNTWTGERVPLIEQQVYRREMSECVQEFIQRMPEIYRTVLVLGELEGLANSEISAVLGVTLQTVKMRLHRAREIIREDLIRNCPSYWVDGNEFLPDLRRIVN